jgi:hypothetical protein
VIGRDLNCEERTFEISSPYLKGIHDGKKFFVVDFLVDFSRGEFPQVISYGVLHIIVSFLGPNCSKYKVGCISFYNTLVLRLK